MEWLRADGGVYVWGGVWVGHAPGCRAGSPSRGVAEPISTRVLARAVWLPAGRDLVDQTVVERFPCIEITSAPDVFGDLLSGPAGTPSQVPV